MTKPIVLRRRAAAGGRGQAPARCARSPNWLPEFAQPRVLDDRAGSLDHTHPASRPITVDDLLTHRAGFGYAFAETGPIAPALERALGNVLHATLTPDQWLKALATLPLLAEPGARFIYGHSTEVLGCLVARIDGGTLGEKSRPPGAQAARHGRHRLLRAARQAAAARPHLPARRRRLRRPSPMRPRRRRCSRRAAAVFIRPPTTISASP